MKKFSVSKNQKYSIAGFMLIIILWQFAAVYLKSQILLPGPIKVTKKIFDLFTENDFYLALFTTVLRWIFAFSISTILGIILGFIAGFLKEFEAIFSIFVSAIKSMPVVSIILLALIWFKSPYVPVFIGILVCFPIIYSNSRQSIEQMDNGLIQMSNCYSVSFYYRLKDMYIPNAIPYFMNAFYICAGMGLKAIIAAEVLSQPENGIGSKMQIARLYLLTEEVLAYTFIAVLIVFAVDKIIDYLKNKVVSWGNGNEL